MLLNVALHGLEEAAGVHYGKLGSNVAQTVAGCPVLVRYADDLVAICHTQQQAEQVKAQLAAWLARRGLTFNEDKTRIVHLSQGYDFLGFNIRRYPNGKLLIKPSHQAIRRIRGRLTAEMRAMNGGNAIGVIRTINPIVRGWSTYYRSVVSKEVFAGVDNHLWWITYQWARRQHPNKSRTWVKARYFGLFNKSRSDRWVFGDRDSGAFLIRFVWTKIVRHQMVAGMASPDDPALAHYWAKRNRRRPTWPVDTLTLKLLNAQRGRCPVCDDLLLLADDQPQSPQQWELWLRTTRKAIKKHSLAMQRSNAEQDDDSIRLVHVHCQPRTSRLSTMDSTCRSAARP